MGWVKSGLASNHIQTLASDPMYLELGHSKRIDSLTWTMRMWRTDKHEQTFMRTRNVKRKEIWSQELKVQLIVFHAPAH